MQVSGVGTKINKLLTLGLDSKKTESERLSFFTDDQHTDILESKTIASALKQYLRKLKEPIMTYRFFNGFLAAAKQEQHLQRISDVHALVHRLPKNHLEMLDIIIRHLRNVASKSHKNKMSIFNLGVVFGEFANTKLCRKTSLFNIDFLISFSLRSNIVESQ